MAVTFTNERILRDVAIGLGWQTIEGTKVTPTTFMLAEEFKMNPNVEKLDPQGTHGSQFKRSDGRRLVALVPTAEMTLLPTAESFPIILKSATNKSFVNDADLTEAGDTGAEFSNWRLVDVEPTFNTDSSNKVFITITAGAKIQVYSDSARTALIAESAVITGTGDAALVEQNNSHLSGTVAVDTFPMTASTSIDLTINTIRFGWRPRIKHFLTLQYDDGGKLFELVDVWVSKIEFSSEEKAALKAVISFAAKELTRPIPAGTATPPLGKPTNFNVFAHKDLTFRDESSAIDVSSRSFTLTIESPHEQYVANSEIPQKIIMDAFVQITGNFTSRMSDEMQSFIDRGLAETLEDLKATYTLSAKDFIMEMKKVSWIPDIPGPSGGVVEDFDADFEAFFDGTTDPLLLELDL